MRVVVETLRAASVDRNAEHRRVRLSSKNLFYDAEQLKHYLGALKYENTLSFNVGLKLLGPQPWLIPYMRLFLENGSDFCL